MLQTIDQFQLVGLVFKDLAGLVSADLAINEGFLRLDQLLHAVFDDFQILRGEASGEIEIVIKAVFNSWSDGDLRFGEQLQHRFCHRMGSGVADSIKF